MVQILNFILEKLRMIKLISNFKYKNIQKYIYNKNIQHKFLILLRQLIQKIRIILLNNIIKQIQLYLYVKLIIIYVQIMMEYLKFKN